MSELDDLIAAVRLAVSLDLRALRLARCVSQRALAARAGVHLSSVLSWEHRECVPRPELLLATLEALRELSDRG